MYFVELLRGYIREDGVLPIGLEALSKFARFMNSSEDKNKVNFVLGIGNNGEILVGDLNYYGTLGVYGVAGSGKTNFVKQMLSSLMLYKSPKEVQFIVLGGYESEYAFLNPLYLHKAVSDNLDLGTEKKDKIIEVLKEVNSEIEKRKQTLDKADKKSKLIICLDELRTPLLTEDDEWYRDICSLIENIISEGPSVGVYTVGIGFGPTNYSKPSYLKGINNAICFKLPTHDAVRLNSIELKLLGFDRGVALCDIIIEESKSLSVANPGEEVLVKTLRMDDKVLEAINSKLSL